jgi:UDP-2,3-diacylglucosamine pyrophosphatase LpxH
MANRAFNDLLSSVGQPRLSLSKTIKNSVKEAIKFVSDFEDTAIELAAKQGYDVVICGHIHQQQKRRITTDKGSVMYLNSGDWVENLSSLEYNNGDWTIYTYDAKAFEKIVIKKQKPVLNVVSEEVMLYINSLAV